MSKVKLTPAQENALRVCAKDVSIVIGSIDATPGISYCVVKRLVAKGLLKWSAAGHMHAHSEWVLTDAGREWLK